MPDSIDTRLAAAEWFSCKRALNGKLFLDFVVWFIVTTSSIGDSTSKGRIKTRVGKRQNKPSIL